MHEAALVQGLLKIALGALDDYEKANPGRKFCRIKEIVCHAGLLAAIELETLRACFEIFAEGTLAEGAALKVDIVPLECECRGCGGKFALDKRIFVCPKCGGMDITFGGGAGLALQAINIECGDNPND